MLDRPLMWSAAAFVAGLILPWPDLPAREWAPPAVTALLGALCLAGAAGSRRALHVSLLMLLAGFAGAGRVAALCSSHHEPHQIATLLGRHPDLFEMGVEVSGTIARLPLEEEDGPGAQLELLVDLAGVKAGRLRLPCAGRVRFRVPAGTDDPHSPVRLRRGSGVVLFGRISPAPRYGNPGSFDYARHLVNRGVDALGTIKTLRLIQVSEPRNAGLMLSGLRLVDTLRETLLREIDRAFEDDAGGRRARAVAAALLLGERRGLGPEESRALQESGLTHLLAVSGFNVAVLAAILLLALRITGCPRRAACLAVIPVLVIYLLLNREESSVARAVIMATAWLGGHLIWRRPDVPSLLGVSSLAILALSPAQIHDAGFQLTFAATLSLIFLPPHLPAPPAGGPFARRVVGWVGGAIVATLAVMIGTLPLTVAHFNRVTPGALPANLIAGPLMAAAFIAVIALEIVAPFSATLAGLAGRVVLNLVDGTFLTADLVVALPGATWRRPAPGALVPVLYCAALFIVLWLSSRGRLSGLAGRYALTAATLSCLLLLAPLDMRGAPEGLRITLLDVGQGDSILIETPRRGRILVDAGGSSLGRFDVGERVVSPALWSMGIARLDALAVTHADVDHLGGAAAIVRNFRPREVWLPAGAADWPERPGIVRLRAALSDAGIVARELARGDRIDLRGARIEVLNPPVESATGRPDNERSLVLGFQSAGRLALLAGDAGPITEGELRTIVERADFLKVGHHGSRTSSSIRFLERIRPVVAGISCGRNNRFGHPSGVVVDRLDLLGARICRTDRDGSSSVELLGLPRRATKLGPECALGPGRRAVRARRG